MFMKVKSVISVLVTAALLLVGCNEKNRPEPTPAPPQPEPPVDPDPITLVTDPGFYGLEGGTALFDTPSLQLSCLEYGDKCSYRLLNPSKVSITSISGLPRQFKAGEKVSFTYRVQRTGHTVALKKYEMTVVQLKDGLVWLKQDDNTYIVLGL